MRTYDPFLKGLVKSSRLVLDPIGWLSVFFDVPAGFGLVMIGSRAVDTGWNWDMNNSWTTHHESQTCLHITKYWQPANGTKYQETRFDETFQKMYPKYSSDSLVFINLERSPSIHWSRQMNKPFCRLWWLVQDTSFIQCCFWIPLGPSSLVVSAVLARKFSFSPKFHLKNFI